jgi:hypothetical protein
LRPCLRSLRRKERASAPCRQGRAALGSVHLVAEGVVEIVAVVEIVEG